MIYGRARTHDMMSSEKFVHGFFLSACIGVLFYQSGNQTSITGNIATILIGIISVVYDTSSYKANINWYGSRWSDRSIVAADAVTITALVLAFVILAAYGNRTLVFLAVTPLFLCSIGQALYLWSMYEADARITSQFNQNMRENITVDDYTDDEDVHTRTYAATTKFAITGNEEEDEEI